MKTATLKAGAFASAIKKVAGDGKTSWSVSDHGAVLENLLPSLVDETGATVTLNPDQLDSIRLIIVHNQEIQNKMLGRIFDEAGYELTDDAKAKLQLMFSVTSFGEFLSKKVDNATGRPFVTKVPKLAKKKAFDALFDEVTVPVAAA